jgi:unspecific monooxygenase
MNSTSVETRTPPGPKAAPTAQALQWIGRPYEYLRECAAQFGDVFALDFGAQGKYVIFSHPEALRSIFTADANVLHVGPGNAVLEPFVGAKSLLLLEEAAHLRERRLLLPAFQPKTVSRHGDVIRDAVHTATAQWTTGVEFDAQTLLQEISIDVILRAVFGLRAPETCVELKSELVTLLNDRRLTMGLLGRLRDLSPDPVLAAFQGRLKRIRDLTKQMISDRRTSAVGDDEGGDVLSMLLAAKDEHGQGQSDEEVRDELLTLVVTGHETTATALAWGLYWIAMHPQVEERLHAEIRALPRALEPKAFARFEYLDATCKEILRIHPVVPSVFRQVVQRFSVGGYDFDPGVVLSPSIFLTHHRKDLYPDGERFDPDRFMRRTFSPYEYLPFGGGARRCIGMHLANYEMKIILATLFERYELSLAPGQNVVPVRRMVAVAPSGGPRMAVKSVLS